jgi:outer membrane protein assembly factor BamB
MAERSMIALALLLLLSGCAAVEEAPPKQPPQEAAPTPEPEPEEAPPQRPPAPEEQEVAKPEVNFSLAWSFDTGEPIYGVDVGRRFIAIAGYDNRVRLLDRSGALLWSFETRGNAEAVALSEEERYLLASSYLVPEARVYLFAVDGEDTRLLWEKELEVLVKGVAVSEREGLVVVGAGDGRVIAYSLAGEPRWSFEIGDSAWGVWDVEVAEGRVALAGDDTYLYLLTSRGELLWKRGGGRHGYFYGCDASSKLVAGVTQDRMLYVFSAEGKPLWKFRSGFANYEVAISQELVALSSWDKRVYLFSAEGELLQVLEFESEPTELDFSPDGRSLAVGSRNGRLYIFTEK